MLMREASFIHKTLFLSVWVMLCFLVFGDAPPAHATATTPTVPYLTSPTGAKWYNKDWVDKEYGMKNARACLANMKSSTGGTTLYAAIEQVWSGTPDASIGRAIACHESGGRTGRHEIGKRAGEGGACAFQIDPKSGYASVAKGIGVSEANFLHEIYTNPVACAKAGRYVLMTHMNSTSGGEKKGLIGGLCNYVGGAHFRQYKEMSTCAMAQELLLVREYVEAANNGSTPDITVTTQDDPEQPCYGCKKVEGANIGTIAVLNCHDYSTSLSADLAKAATAYQNAVRIATNAFQKNMIKAQAANPIRYAYGDIEKTYCINDVFRFFNTLAQFTLTDLAAAIVSIVLAVLEDLLNQVCQLVLQAVTNVLTMICLPLPDLSLRFKIPGLDNTSCDGVSLADYVKVVGGVSASDLISSTGTQIPQPAPPSSLGYPLPYILDNVVRSKTATKIY